MDITTMRIGPFKMTMLKSEAQAFTKISLKKAVDVKGWPVPNVIKYNEELVEVTIDNYFGNGNTSKDAITELRTTSTKFRTKSGMGVGSTRYELLNVYRDYSNFEIMQDWDEVANKPSTNKSHFILKDEGVSFSTKLSFQLVDNIVTEVSIYLDYGD